MASSTADNLSPSAIRSFFFFSSRRLHTRCYRDGSSDVCSSDLTLVSVRGPSEGMEGDIRPWHFDGVRSEERRVGKSVDLGGRRIIKKKKKIQDDKIVVSSDIAVKMIVGKVET